MLHADLHNWANNGRDFKTALLLYEQIKGADIFHAMAQKNCTSVVKDKIMNVVNTRYEELQNHINAINVTKPKHVEILPKQTLPESIRKAYADKSYYYKQMLEGRSMIKKLINAKYMQPAYTLVEALAIMAQKDNQRHQRPFSIDFITWNNTTKQGGELIHYDKATLVSLNPSGLRTIAGGSNPNHWKNNTRNIKIFGTQDVRKVNVWLIMAINGIEVVLNDKG